MGLFQLSFSQWCSSVPCKYSLGGSEVSQCTLGQSVAFQWHSSVHWTSQCTLSQGKGDLCAGNLPGTGELPAPGASNAEMFPFDDVIMHLPEYDMIKYHVLWMTSINVDHTSSRYWCFGSKSRSSLLCAVTLTQFAWTSLSLFDDDKLNRDDSRLAPSQQETSLQCNTVYKRLGANLEPALVVIIWG